MSKIICKDYALCPLIEVELNSRGLSMDLLYSKLDQALLNQLKEKFTKESVQSIINAGLAVALMYQWTPIKENSFSFDKIINGYNLNITKCLYNSKNHEDWLEGGKYYEENKNEFGYAYSFTYIIDEIKSRFAKGYDGSYIIESNEIRVVHNIDIYNEKSDKRCTLIIKPTKVNGIIPPFKLLYFFSMLGLNPVKNKIVHKSFRNTIDVIYDLLLTNDVIEGFYK